MCCVCPTWFFSGVLVIILLFFIKKINKKKIYVHRFYVCIDKSGTVGHKRLCFPRISRQHQWTLVFLKTTLC